MALYPDVSGPVVVELVLLIESSDLRLVLGKEVRHDSNRCSRGSREHIFRRRNWCRSRRRHCRRFERWRRRRLSARLSSQPLAVGREADCALHVILEDVFLGDGRPLGHNFVLWVKVRVHVVSHWLAHGVYSDRRQRVGVLDGDTTSVEDGWRLDGHLRPATLVLVEIVKVSLRVERSWDQKQLFLLTFWQLLMTLLKRQPLQKLFF